MCKIVIDLPVYCIPEVGHAECSDCSHFILQESAVMERSLLITGLLVLAALIFSGRIRSQIVKLKIFFELIFNMQESVQ